MSVKIFLLCLLSGIAVGIIEGGLSPLRKRLGLMFTVLSDLCLAFISVFMHAVISYLYCDGRIFAYAVAAQAVGLIAARCAAAKLSAALYRRLQKSSKRRRAAKSGNA